ncbi:bifunctional DNA-binding transcriptional dual regulator/O6-methylguanine-DNA methyltransferase [Variovorax sp. PBL-H6]|uniref:AraC family transcriptional regulator n=1 Tax=Variovorax sp. PBL-H6 TaxID=434009 RepID=UPI0013182033|nr:helix-turn-helix domain-containing protein [Variovorax sp. PBL-H6]VTU18579.1 bifunctional DNA-binding transcriptional dual regulator/O6-methylguanine-DNA methyltransferase [Variovorax sp. PBL-H6]
MSIHAIHAAPAKRFHVAHACAAAALPGLHVASLGLVDVDAFGGGVHRGLPHELFMVTAYCDERLDCRSASDGGALRVMVSALRTRPVDFQTQGRGQMAVAMLTPLGLLRAFGRPWDNLCNERLPLRELVPPYLEAMLHGALIDAAAGPERCLVFGRWLEARIGERRALGWQAERVAAAAMSLLEAPALSVDMLACQHLVSRRQLERDFRHWLGVAPAGYARLVRFQRAACGIAEGVPLAHVAAEQGYADQAHMTRAFSETAGVTPRQLREGGGPARALRAAFAQRMIMLPAGREPEALRLAA